jgi:hypothetical protein
MIRETAGDSFDREGTPNQAELAKAIDQFSLDAIASAGKLKVIDSQGSLPVDLEVQN